MSPTLTGYSLFLFDAIRLSSTALPPFSGTGTLLEGSVDLTVVTVAVNWLEAGAIVTDADGAIQPQTTVGEPLTAGMYPMSLPATATVATPEAISATNPWIVSTFQASKDTVNRAIAKASGRKYTEAIYNLGADLLINVAVDQPNQSYFRDMRRGYRIEAPSFGLPASASDQGTSGALVNPEFMRNLTLDDLQRMKTPYGRAYLGIAQAFGPALFGLG